MAKRIMKINPEEQQKSLLDSGIKNMEEKISFGILKDTPTRFFNVDDRVHVGAHKEVYVREIYRDGLYYKVECIGVTRERNSPPVNEFHLWEWFKLYPYMSFQDTQFKKEEKYWIRLSNSGIASLLHMVYHAGVDFDVEYQREHVWSLDDKIALIDSIYNNIDIGKFVFVQRNFSYLGKLYEIIDGKQRLTALCEFYEDRFPYKGYYFSQLSGQDKNKFENHGITYGYLENPDMEAILETFIKLNTCGKPMEHKHIEKVQELLNNIKNK